MPPTSTSPLELVCCHCKGPLSPTRDALLCSSCGVRFPCVGGIADFSEGHYYDNFTGPEVLSEENLRGLANEKEAARMDDFYLPILNRIARDDGTSIATLRVLDSGCGNGESVDFLNRNGVETWGHDLSALRKWQWRERDRRDRLVVADGASLPFSDGSFHVVISSGVLEHIGVAEEGGGRYKVQALPDRDERRGRYLSELLRITTPAGSVFLDFPNGSFPIDFWHGVKPGGARFHSPWEGFLPTVPEVRALCRRIDSRLVVSVRSPRGRLRFKQVSSHWYGRVFRTPMAALHRLMSTSYFGFLAATPINPYLVIEVERSAAK